VTYFPSDLPELLELCLSAKKIKTINKSRTKVEAGATVYTEGGIRFTFTHFDGFEYEVKIYLKELSTDSNLLFADCYRDLTLSPKNFLRIFLLRKNTLPIPFTNIYDTRETSLPKLIKELTGFTIDLFCS
jgi:hypothetical protein